MAKQYQIKWKQTDYLSLGRAISNFNKTKNELIGMEKYNNVILPETLNYQDVKDRIKTRAELNRVISSLREFGKGKSLEIYKTEMGDKILNWEHKELEGAKRRIVKRLTANLEKYQTPNEQGYTRAQMGSTTYRKLMNNIEKFTNYEANKGYDFKEMRNVMYSIGDKDYTVRKAIVYRDNYIKVMKKYEHFDNYKLLERKMQSLKNPVEFFEFFDKDEITVDLTYQSDQFYSQQEFNSFLERLGIDIDEDTINSEERG